MYPRGSEWRRWDLHVHTPDTVLNNQFSDWNSYLRAIEAQTDVVVMGVTDYMSIENYSKLRTYRLNKRIPNIELLIPNIEFRISPPTEKATAVNIHLLVSPHDDDHEANIQDALGRLDWEYNKRRYSCLPNQLRALGRAFDPSIKDDKPALEAGVLQFKVDFTRFRDWYNSEHWLNQNSIVAVAAGADGLSAFRRDGAWAAHRDEITRFSSIIFSARPGERDFWIGNGSNTDQDTMRKLGGPKPCIHGSDAHKLSKLFKPTDDRFCWIKADPTFEGLRQILYEPADRVFIGPTPPLYHDQARVIRSITVRASSGWFDDVTIPLNPGLISVIGQKGSGKSALAETMAHAGGSWKGVETGCFLSRAGAHLDGLEVELQWADGRGSAVTLGSAPSSTNEVRYLSQNFVERLCSGDSIGDELVKEIEGVVFSYIDPADTLNASSFDELRAMRTEGLRREGERLRAEIRTHVQNECTLRDTISKLPEKRARVKILEEEREGLKKQIPTATTQAEQQLQQELQTTRDSLTKLQAAAAQDKLAIQKISDIRTRVAAFAGQMDRFYKELTPLLADVGVPPSDQAAFHPQYGGDTKRPLDTRVTEIQKRLSDRDGAPTNPATIRGLLAKLEVLQKQETADRARQERTKAIHARLSAIAAELERLNAEVNHVETVERQRLLEARSSRTATYVSYFENLRHEHDALADLYAPVRQRLGAASEKQEQNLEFSVRWEVDLERWLERGAPLFDQRRTLPYGSMQGLREAARSVLVPAWTSGEPTAIGIAMEKFLSEFNKALPFSNFLRSAVTPQDLLNWLFDVAHVRLSYGLKYNGIDLENLSPGTKGIVLLILYLGMDMNDTRPLIVDQPDENLDNESIYTLLTAYFKKAKARRQIILITHNPNLVVNTDAEQVIVAEMEKRPGGLPYIKYSSGSLENTVPPVAGIREQVCRILEGGADAFLKRERRYALTTMK